MNFGTGEIFIEKEKIEKEDLWMGSIAFWEEQK